MNYRTHFTTPYEQFAAWEGQPFEVLQVITEPTPNFDAEVLPMYRIRFTNDGTEALAWPEEVEATHERLVI